MFKVDSITDTGTGLGIVSINEDCFLIQHNLFAVFDGAGSITKSVYDGKTGGYWAANIARNIFTADNQPLERMALAANLAIREGMLKTGVDMRTKQNLWSTKFASVRVHSKNFEWAQVSDCLIMVIKKDGSFHLTTPLIDHDRELLDHWKKSGSEKPPSQAFYNEWVELRMRSNVDYGDLNSEPDVIKFIKHGVEPLDEVEHILLFTDGMFIPREEPMEEPDFGKIRDLYLKDGLKGWLKHNRSMEESDPSLRKYPRYKLHDDATAIAITFK